MSKLNITNITHISINEATSSKYTNYILKQIKIVSLNVKNV